MTDQIWNAAWRVSCALAVGLLGTAGAVRAQDPGPATSLAAPAGSGAEADSPRDGEAWSLHGQATVVHQFHPSFRSRYAGANSLSASASQRETADITAYLGVRPWAGGELYVNPEIDQGFGLSNTVGVAGYPSGEAYKVGRSDPYLRWNRLFLRQVFALGPASRQVDAGANALAGRIPEDSVIVTVGKFSVPDIFDINAYAHDARADFLNWSLIDAGAFDYAADAWGYTDGIALEVNKGDASARVGVFALSDVPNSQKLDSSFRQYAAVWEGEARYAIAGHPGKSRILGFVNRGRMGGYDDAILAAKLGSAPDTALVRRDAGRAGVGLNVEQEIRSGLGLFMRASANDGKKEAFEFTEINRSLSGGVAAKAIWWNREADTLGVGLVRNSLSLPARRYFAAGGMGILIGDGALQRYGAEQIVEAYYNAQLSSSTTLGADFQRIDHPAYNRDRGPVSVFALRLHWAR